MTDDFVHLHTHSDASGFDGFGRPIDFFRRAAELGQPALGFTDHGTLRGLHDSALAAAETGVRQVPAIEAYFAEDATARGLTRAEKKRLLAEGGDPKRADAERRDRAHATIWAVNQTGLRNLYRLTSWAWTEGHYYKPRLDMARLREHAEGLAISTGCPSGIVARPLHRGDPRLADERMRDLAEIFGDRLYVELMPHLPMGGDVRQPRIGDLLVRLADRYGARLLATQDAHYPLQGDAAAHDRFLAIMTNEPVDKPGRFRFDGSDYWLRSRAEMDAAMRAAFPDLPADRLRAALDETVAFAERCTGRVEAARAGQYLAAPDVPAGMAGYPEWLGELVAKGLRERCPGAGAGYVERIHHELGTIVRSGYAPYFLMVWDVVAWARANGILVGPGRGSAAGSLVAYVLGITDLDPLRHGLSFDRFLAPGRVDLPDIDLDFEDRYRERVIDYLRETYGRDRVAHIATYGRLGGRQSLRDLARLHGVPEREIAEVSNLIPRVTAGEEEGADSARRVLETTERGREFAERYPDVYAMLDRVEGLIKSVGIHAAGVVVSSVPLTDVCPVESRERDGRRVACTAWDMRGVEWAGLVKFDALGLRALTVIARACEIAGLDGESIPSDEVPEVFEQIFSAGDLAGIFQFDTPSARRVSAGLRFRALADVAAVTALNRPGPMLAGLVDVYRRGSANPDLVGGIHPIVDEILAETYGTLIYQEQVVSIVRVLGGFGAGRADALRRKISKKKRGIAEDAEDFVDGAVKRGMGRDEAEGLFAQIVGFGRYSFGKSHSYAYGALAVKLGWLKVHRPAPFFAAALEGEETVGGQVRLAAAARRRGIPIGPPCVSTSAATRMTLSPDGEIVGALADLKGVGAKTATAIADGSPYESLADFVDRAGAKRGVTIATFGILSRAGAFRRVAPDAPVVPLAEQARDCWREIKAGRPYVVEGEPALAGERVRQIASVWPMYHEEGMGLLDHTEAALRRVTDRPIYCPGDPDLGRPGGHWLILGRVTHGRIFVSRDRESQSGRLVLGSSQGEEISLRADQDVLDQAGSDLVKPERIVLVLARAGMRGGLAVDAGWSIREGALPRDPMLVRAVLKPAKTRPRDPAAALGRLEKDGRATVEGVVVRRREHLDKRKRRMLTLGLLGSGGGIRLMVWASRVDELDGSALALGSRIVARIEKLDDGTGALLSARRTGSIFEAPDP